MSPQGDSLTLSNVLATNVYENPDGSYTTYCDPGEFYGGMGYYGFCGYVDLYDSVSGYQTTTNNTQSDTVYDACGTEVDYGSTYGWHIVGSNPEYMSSGWITADMSTVPTSGVCYGTWSVSYTYSQTFTDGATLSETVVATYQVYPSKAGADAAANPQQSPTGGPIDPSEEYGGCGCGYPSHGSTGDPVDTASGNFWHTFDDIAIPGRGPAIDLSRTYNSLGAATDGPFGYGWTDSYAMSLSIGSSTVVVNQANGAQATFTQSGSAWSAPPRVLATLVHNGDGSWTFTRQARKIYTFDATGRLTAIADLNGYRTTVTYPDSSTTVVTDPAGRSLTFTYTGNHVTSVQDSSSPARSLSYSYDGAGNLTDVVDVGGGHWQYTYDGAHRLLTIRSPRYYGDTTTSPAPVVTNDYDGSGRVDWQSDQLGRTTSYDYTSIAGATKVTDPKGNVTVYGYDYGLLTSMTRGYGTTSAATWYYRYDPDTTGRTLTIDPNDHTTSSTYDADGNVTSTTDGLGRATSYTYNGLDEVTSTIEPKQVNGQPVVTQMAYDNAGNLLTRSAPLLDSTGATSATATTTYHYGDPAHPGDVTSVTDPNGHTTTYAYDAYGDLTSMTDPAGDTTTYGYDTDKGWRTSMVSPKGNVTGGNPAAYTTTYAYDAYGRPTVTKDPLWTSTAPTKHETTRHYDADGNLDSLADGDGNTTTYTYDAAGEQTAIHRPGGTTLRADYYADGTIHHQYDGAGNATTYSYDPLGHLSSVADGLGRPTQVSYDPVGNLLTRTDPAGRTTTSSYDAADEVVSTTYSDGVTPNVTGITYDADGQRTAMTDGTGTTTWTWDTLHRLTSSTNGAGQTVGYHYDLGGRLTAIDYPGGAGTVTRAYDDAGRLTAVTDWNNHKSTFGYDANSNLTTGDYANGTTATSTFDTTDRATGFSDAPTGSPGSPFATFGYDRDGAGLVTSVTSTGVPSDNHTYGYDPLGHLTGVDAATYSYDAADNLTKRLDNTQQAFDAADEITASTTNPPISLVGTASAGDSTSSALTVSLPAGTSAGDQVLLGTTLAYGKSVTTPTGYTVVGTYSSGTSNTSAKTVVYRHTVAAGDTSVTISFQGKIAKTVALAVYHNVHPNTPIDVTASGSTAGGTSVTAPSLSTTVTGDRLVMFAGASGTAGTWTMPAGMSTRAQRTGGSTDLALADETVTPVGATGSRTATHSASTQLVGVLVTLEPAQTSYGYDAQGNRTHVAPLSGAATNLTYDQANRLTAYGSTTTYTYNGDGLRMSKTVSGTTEAFAWDVAESEPLLLADGSTDYVYGPGGLPLEQVTSTATLYYHHDQLGSTRALTDGSGSVVATYSYDPYGNLTGSTGSVANPFRYAGEYTDAESGLVYLRARYYDPSTAQFLGVDPLAALTQAPYGYAGDDPLNAVDPLGLSWWNPTSWNWDEIGTVAGYVGVGVAVVGIGVATAGVGDVVIAGGVTVGTAVDATAVGAGAIAAGVDCGKDLVSAKCALDAASLGTGAGGMASDVKGLDRLGLGLNGASVVTGAAALGWPESSEAEGENPC